MRMVYLVVLLLWALGAQAQEKFRTFGPGAVKCGEFVSIYENPKTGRETLYQFESWTQGYISALARHLNSPIYDPSPDMLVRAAYSFCKTNPKSSYAEGAHEVFLSAQRVAQR